MKKLTQNILFIGLLAFTLLACKKDQSGTIEIAIESDALTHLQADVTISDIWLNYTTKKSNSEWMKLDLVPGVYDLAHLYNNDKDTIILPAQTIEGLETFLQIRMHFGGDSTRVITMLEDTVKMTTDMSAINGLQVAINKRSSQDKKHTLKLLIAPDSTAIHGVNPIFKPSISLKSFTEN